MPPSQPYNKAQDDERPGRVNGNWFIGITLSLFIVVPAVVIGVTWLTGPPPQRPPLVYAERETWQPQEVRARQLEYNMFVAAETGRRYRKANFPLELDDEAMLHRAVQLVQRDDFFQSESASVKLTAWAEQYPAQFYPAYLLAEWMRVNGRAQEATQWRDTAFRRASGALLQQLTGEDGAPAAGHTLAPVAIAYDRVIDQRLDATLMLVYPRPTADAQGRVYLPTFESVYRLTDPTLPPGAASATYPPALTLLPQTPTRQTPHWFSAPHRVGRLPNAVVQTHPAEPGAPPSDE